MTLSAGQAPVAELITGRIVLPDIVVSDGALALTGSRIVAAGDRRVVENQLAASGLAVRAVELPPDTTLLPGLVDVHCHGAAGAEFGNDPLAAGRAAHHHHRNGTTTLVASVVSAPAAQMVAQVSACAQLAAQGLVAGVHLEGPFLSGRRRGAQDPGALRPVDLDLLRRLLTATAGHGVSMTLAPELTGSHEVIDLLAAGGLLPAIGHTDADADTTSAALDYAHERLGGRRPLVTHLFNGMSPFHHRQPGAAGAALAAAVRGEAVVELIGDGVHLSPAAVRLALDGAAAGCAVLVSDATAATGMPDGRHRLGALDVDVAGGAAMLADGSSLAGSVVTLLDVVRRTWEAGIPLERAVAAASAHPAAVLGMQDELGALAAGLRCDVVAVDAGLHVRAVWRGGRRCGPAEEPRAVLG